MRPSSAQAGCGAATSHVASGAGQDPARPAFPVPGGQAILIDSPRKLLIIGVDAGSPELFRRWGATGDLPHLHRLMTQGTARRILPSPDSGRHLDAHSRAVQPLSLTPFFLDSFAIGRRLIDLR